MCLEVEMQESRSAKHIQTIGSYNKRTVNVFDSQTIAWKVNVALLAFINK